MTPSEAQATHWDIIVIGAGMGGGIAGRRLAEQGLSVLFVEKGPAGYRKEGQGLSSDISDPNVRRTRGYWPKPVEAYINGQTSRFFAPIGSGIGGSSVFYAGALERPERHDLDEMPGLPHPTGGWPVGYDAFTPYFAQAEEILHITGAPDPLSSEPIELKAPSSLPEGDAAMMEDFRSLGLHPYRLHLAIKQVPGCAQCVGVKCPRQCKMDGRSAGVEPALETGRAHLLDDCDIRELLETDGAVTGLAARCGGTDVILRAKTYVLAAGALGSPRLLLASKSTHPQGCANSSDWVGRGLMFHLNEIFALWPRRGQGFEGASKAISLRDIYTHEGQRLGMVQSMGLEASYGKIAQYLQGIYDRSPLKNVSKLRKFVNIPAAIGARILGNAKVFVGLMEDLAYPENRVVLNEQDAEVLTFHYTISPELRARRKLFRRQIRRAFKGRRKLMLGQQVELNFGHPSGTLRFGTDPETSVCDGDCKAHDLSNLYVADASFMPTSMGVNPSLVIAANALRVGDIIARRMKGQG